MILKCAYCSSDEEYTYLQDLQIPICYNCFELCVICKQEERDVDIVHNNRYIPLCIACASNNTNTQKIIDISRLTITP